MSIWCKTQNMVTTGIGPWWGHNPERQKARNVTQFQQLVFLKCINFNGSTEGELRWSNDNFKIIWPPTKQTDPHGLLPPWEQHWVWPGEASASSFGLQKKKALLCQGLFQPDTHTNKALLSLTPHFPGFEVSQSRRIALTFQQLDLS